MAVVVELSSNMIVPHLSRRCFSAKQLTRIMISSERTGSESAWTDGLKLNGNGMAIAVLGLASAQENRSDIRSDAASP